MAEDPWFKWYPKDFLTDEKVRLMSVEEIGLYVLCLNYAWLNEGLPGDANAVQELLQCASDVFERSWKKVEKCFVFEGDRFVNQKMEALRLLKNKVSRSRKRAANVRWKCNASADASAYANTMQTHGSGSTLSTSFLEDKEMSDLYDFFCEQYSRIGAVPANLWQSFPKYVTGFADLLKENLPLWVEAYEQSGRFAPNAQKFLSDQAWKNPPPKSWTSGPKPKSSMEGIE